MQLRTIAHARTGDKGTTLNISVIAYRIQDYPLLEKYLSAERVKACLQDRIRGDVIRYPLPRIGAINFVLYQALDGGVTRTLALDAHQKSLSSALLRMELPES